MHVCASVALKTFGAKTWLSFGIFANTTSMKSIWNNTEQQEQYAALNQDITTSIVVVGGGIAGIMCAYYLAKRGEQVVLVEANTLCSGVTSCTTAHITTLQGYVYTTLVKKQSLEFARRYYESQQFGLNEIAALVNKYSINCDLVRLPSLLYCENKSKHLVQEYEILKAIGAPVEWAKQQVNNKTVQGIRMHNQACFHPLKFLQQLPKKFKVYENTRVVEVDLKLKVLTTNLGYKIAARKIIFATNYPIVNVRGGYIFKLKKHNSYAITINTKCTELSESEQENGLTFRPYSGGSIVGGLDHPTGLSDSHNKLKCFAKKLSIKQADVANFWCANDVITHDCVPFAGYFSPKLDEVFIITGFNKWGMANAVASATVIADAITGRVNRYSEVFSPQRYSVSVGFFVSNALQACYNWLIKPFFLPVRTAKSLKKGEGGIVWHKWRKQAVYKDIKGELHVCQRLCKHANCELAFNHSSKTWDCPCHGSRYDIDGSIITSPTVEHLCPLSAEQLPTKTPSQK